MANEPPTKKSRKMEEEDTPSEEKEIERSITINLSKYSEWVRGLSDQELEKIFEVGVLVRESLQMTVNSNQKHLEKVLESQLDSQMKPVQEKVANIKDQVSKEVQEINREVTQSVTNNISQMSDTVIKFKQEVNGDLTKIKTHLVSEVSKVADKVIPLDSLNKKIEESKEKILEGMKKIDESVQALGKPQTKGSMGERLVLDILKEGLPNSFTVQQSATFGKSGDVLVTTHVGEKFPIEVKNHDSRIQKQEIEKFEKVVLDDPQFNAGIMLSLKSGIARRSERGKFEVYLDENKYLIYVPNALKEENLIVWSVMLANELANMNAELKDNHKEKLRVLYEKFQKSIDNAKMSRSSLKSLEEVVKKLKESMEPILDIVEQSRSEIYTMLH